MLLCGQNPQQQIHKDVKEHHLTDMKQVHTTVPQVPVGSVAGF
jgi:hypothetical protein